MKKLGSVMAVALLGVMQSWALTIDATKFRALGAPDDICLAIQAAIASLPSNSASGVVIDARNFSPSTATTPGTDVLVCTVNPFSVSTDGKTLVLAFGGFSGTGGNLASPGSAGGVVLLPGVTIKTTVPWFVPGTWSIIGEGSGITVLVANFSPTSVTGSVQSTSGTQVTGNSPGWGPSVVGMLMMICGTTTCTTTPTNAQVVGIVTHLDDSSHLELGTSVQATLSTNTYNYLFQAPLMAWATTIGCTSGSCVGALQKQTFGSVIQDIGLSCFGITNCLPFWDQYGQERSQLKRLSISDFSGIGIGIYTGNAQNGGPFDDLQVSVGLGTEALGTICVEVGGNGVGGAPPMRGIRGITCTGTSGSAPTGSIGVDINTQNFTMSNAHFENFDTGVEMGANASAIGIGINDLTGGIFTGTGDSDRHVNTILDISSTNASASPPTGNIKISNVYQPGNLAAMCSACKTLKDNISGSSGNTVSEVTLGFYSLGDGTGSAGASTRPVLTTSSTVSVSSTGPQVKTVTTTPYSVVGSDRGKLLIFNGTSIAATLPQAGTTGTLFGGNFSFNAKNISTTDVTLTPTTSTIDGLSSLTLHPGASVVIFSDNTNYFTIPVPIDTGGVNSQTSSYTATVADKSKMILMNGSSLTLTLPTTPPSNNWYVTIFDAAPSVLTVSSSANINGGSSAITLQHYQSVRIYSNASAYFTDGLPLISGANVPLTTATNGMTVSAQGSIVTKTANYTLTSSDSTVLCNGNITLTLPTTGISTGQIFTVKNIGTSHICTVSSSANIDGSTFPNISTQNFASTFQWDGTAWWVLSNKN
jgi:hypothetical protein